MIIILSHEVRRFYWNRTLKLHFVSTIPIPRNAPLNNSYSLLIQVSFLISFVFHNEIKLNKSKLKVYETR